jgi:transcriptional regulator with XRE-family HTH domain
MSPLACIKRLKIQAGELEFIEGLERHRQALGRRLQELRQSAGINSRDLAAALGWSQSRVSRFETARQTPTREEILAFARAVGRPDAADELAADLDSLEQEWIGYRATLRGQGAQHRQGEVQEIEATCREKRAFQQALIPGLLQTPEYIWALTKLATRFRTEEEAAGVVELRLERQQVLRDRKKRFWFIVTESALWNRYAPPGVMIGQYERLLKEAGRKNVRFGVIPRTAQLPTTLNSGFTIWDDQLVTIETTSGDVVLRHRDDIAEHFELFERLRSCAVAGEAAEQIVQQIARSFV